MTKLLRPIDFEVDGLEPTDPVVEIGWCDVTIDDQGDTSIGAPMAKLCDPGRPMSAQARGVHHITDEEVAGNLAFSWAIRDLSDADVYVAHNASYEQQYFGIGAPWICTYKCALRLFPEAPDHKLQTLRYWLDLPVDLELAMPPHRAAPDAYVGAHLLIHLLALQDVDTLVRWSAGPALLVKVGFGKHRGKRFEEAVKEDVKYFRDWVLNNFGTEEQHDRDVRATTKYYLRKIGELQ